MIHRAASKDGRLAPNSPRVSRVLGGILLVLGTSALASAAPSRPAAGPGPSGPRSGAAPEVRRVAEAPAPSRSIYAPALLSSYRRSMEIESDIGRACATYGVPLNLARAVCMYESGASDMLVSGDGARGFFQVMPATFRLMGVSTNIEAGVKYLSWLLRDYGREDDALAAYNGGPGRMKSGRLPIETVQYVVGVGIYKTLLTREESAIRTDASRLLLHRVEPDEDWDRIAARTKIPVLELKLYNPYFAARPLRSGLLMAYPAVSEGAVVEPAPPGAATGPGASAVPSSYYVTRRGDNYLMLAFAFDVDLEQFRSDNTLWRIQVPFEGMKMLITPRDRTASAANGGVAAPGPLGQGPAAAPRAVMFDEGPAGGPGRMAEAQTGPANGTVAAAPPGSPDGDAQADAGGDGAPATGAEGSDAGEALGAHAPIPYSAHGAPGRAASLAPPPPGPAARSTRRSTAARARPAKTVVHRVQRGETLTRIASRYGVTVEAILGLNALRQSRIVVGQRLRIPLD